MFRIFLLANFLIDFFSLINSSLELHFLGVGGCRGVYNFIRTRNKGFLLSGATTWLLFHLDMFAVYHLILISPISLKGSGSQYPSVGSQGSVTVADSAVLGRGHRGIAGDPQVTLLQVSPLLESLLLSALYCPPVSSCVGLDLWELLSTWLPKSVECFAKRCW